MAHTENSRFDAWDLLPATNKTKTIIIAAGRYRRAPDVPERRNHGEVSAVDGTAFYYDPTKYKTY
jgi:thioredoxin reductase